MANFQKLNVWDWNRMNVAFTKESDRGAAVLLGGFVEAYLANYLRAHVVDETVAEQLFQGFGPLSSFSQRILIGQAFGFLGKTDASDATLIRKIRNHFAHHPLDATFDSPEINKYVIKLSQQPDLSDNEEHSNNRKA